MYIYEIIGGYFTSGDSSKLLKASILHFCSIVSITAVLYLKWSSILPIQLKDEAIGLCDVLAPPDHILQSAIGSSDGQVYFVTCTALDTSAILLAYIYNQYPKDQHSCI